MNLLRKIQLLLCFSFLINNTYSYNLRQLSNKDGLSNSAILSICQDHDRFMWFGSCDGLNMYDGINIQVYKPTTNNSNCLSGNLIEGIMEAEEGILWVATNHGFNRLNKSTSRIEYHNEFQGLYHWTKNKMNQVFAIHEDNMLDYYDKINKQFTQIYLKGIINSEIRSFFIDNENVLWIFTNDGKITNYSIKFKNEFPEVKQIDNYTQDVKISCIFQQGDLVFFIDENSNFFELNVITKKKTLIQNLGNLLVDNGVVSSIIRDEDDYLIAFKTNGLFRLDNTPENEIKYRLERINIYCGVFSLWKDDVQDIIWIGTDGQGVYMYSRDSFSIRSTVYKDFPYNIQKPVRALLWDDYRNLWIGTKDDGLLLVKNYQVGSDLAGKEINHLTTSNSDLINNAVYAFAKSKRNLLWIGGDGPGLNYYSYKERKVKKIPSKSKETINYVHSICEVNDSVLWLATVGSGVLKIIISGSEDSPQIESVQRTTFIKNDISYNYFFSVYRENDSILWFGNRGYGAQRLNLNTERFEQLKFYKKDIETINDILSIYKDSNGKVWFGSSFGVTKLLKYDKTDPSYENYNEIEGLPNNTIHGILEDARGYLWLSTNSGIVQFDTETKSFRTYNHNNGLDVIEFSDGASYKDDKTGILFFGGTNGFVTIAQDNFMGKRFIPQIFFTGLKIYEKEENLASFMKDGKDNCLELKYDQNFFSISFIALDYINGQNCKYIYNLENFSEKWIDNGRSNVVNFTNISPGKYTLHVRCKNDDGEFSDDLYSMKIVILPPWYLSKWAYILYAFLILIVGFVSVQIVRRQYIRKKLSTIEKMNQQQREKIYESKLRFFTNITHELCTPLTLIQGPCMRILSYPGADDFVKKYSNLILKNSERLNSLIQELIEFRRIETGHKSCVIEQLSITKLAEGITESFGEFAESKNIDYQIKIRDNILWNSDGSCLTKIITNLLSNAFKYTPDNGKIELILRIEDDQLELIVSNSGKGIKTEDIPFIFDRYRILENFEKQSKRGNFSRNGLGLSICYSMVKLLQGEITIESVQGENTIFSARFPMLEITNDSVVKNLNEENLHFLANQERVLPFVENNDYQFTNKYVKARPTIMIVDDDPEMLWFVSEIFSEQYNIIPIKTPQNLITELEKNQPSLIISDIMMPNLDGVSLMKEVRKNKQTAHIPFILLSAKITPEEQIEGIAAGAEAYITKPFNVNYLKSVVGRLLQRHDDLKDYYHSPKSTFEFINDKYIHVDDKKFFNKMIHIIDEHLNDSEFSTMQLASHLGMSVRHLYRRLKKITEQTPADIIKEYRMSEVEKLLLTTQLSVDEIMYKAGFSNRGNFYKAFSQKFGMTPKRYRDTKVKGIF